MVGPYDSMTMMSQALQSSVRKESPDCDCDHDCSSDDNQEDKGRALLNATTVAVPAAADSDSDSDPVMATHPKARTTGRPRRWT